MNNLLHQADNETICEEAPVEVHSRAISQLADLQLAMVGGGVGDVLWG